MGFFIRFMLVMLFSSGIGAQAQNYIFRDGRHSVILYKDVAKKYNIRSQGFFRSYISDCASRAQTYEDSFRMNDTVFLYANGPAPRLLCIDSVSCYEQGDCAWDTVRIYKYNICFAIAGVPDTVRVPVESCDNYGKFVASNRNIAALYLGNRSGANFVYLYFPQFVGPADRRTGQPFLYFKLFAVK